jgi:hypothetical protein
VIQIVDLITPFDYLHKFWVALLIPSGYYLVAVHGPVWYDGRRKTLEADNFYPGPIHGCYFAELTRFVLNLVAASRRDQGIAYKPSYLGS